MPEPTIGNQYGGTSTIIPRNANFAQDNEANGSINGRKDGRKELTERQTHIVESMLRDGTISAKELSEKFNISIATIKRDLAKLQKLKIIEHKGSNKDGYWNVLP